MRNVPGELEPVPGIFRGRFSISGFALGDAVNAKAILELANPVASGRRMVLESFNMVKGFAAGSPVASSSPLAFLSRVDIAVGAAPLTTFVAHQRTLYPTPALVVNQNLSLAGVAFLGNSWYGFTPATVVTGPGAQGPGTWPVPGRSQVGEAWIEPGDVWDLGFQADTAGAGVLVAGSVVWSEWMV